MIHKHTEQSIFKYIENNLKSSLHKSQHFGVNKQPVECKHHLKLETFRVWRHEVNKRDAGECKNSISFILVHKIRRKWQMSCLIPSKEKHKGFFNGK